MSAEENDAAGAGREFVFTHVFDAPRERVFQLWTEGRYMEQWWGPHGSTNPVHVWEARPGGSIHIDMVAADGLVHPMDGTFHKVLAPNLIVFTSRAFNDEAGNARFETFNTITLVDHEGKTKVTVRAIVVKAFTGVLQALDGIELGWTQSLERLEQLLTKD